jgi:hypothetical protein
MLQQQKHLRKIYKEVIKTCQKPYVELLKVRSENMSEKFLII